MAMMAGVSAKKGSPTEEDNQFLECLEYEQKSECKPTFSSVIKDVEVVEGSAARFDCKIEGYPDPEVVWYKDDQPIKETRHSRSTTTRRETAAWSFQRCQGTTTPSTRDSLVVYVVCSQRSLHRPMYVFVAAVLVNSAVGSSAVYPKLLWDLLQGRRVILITRSACFVQAVVLSSVGSSSFLLLSTMAFDRYLSICHPLRYTVLMSPAVVTALLLLCWLVPPLPIVGAGLIANSLEPCRDRVTRLYCAMYTYVNLSCSEGHMLSNVFNFLINSMLFILPTAFVLFSYGRILVLCLHRSRTFASKALNTCLPHVIVLLNYFVCNTLEMMNRTVPAGEHTRETLTSTVLTVVVTTVSNPSCTG
ncbi:hypothetical protein WMY93_003367 [Mugilogobius chulae]|uniref:G-protein coupled receptors family 1 profile domain-containing protein n=1 Tax=Mugilogobius chulae TaxID=88201 RepID=A0AAW0QBG3_9GOBI